MRYRPGKQNSRWIVVLVIFSLIIVFFQLFFSQHITSDFSGHMREQRKEAIRKMVQLAYNSVKPVAEKVRTGELDRLEARKMIGDYVRRMTYKDEFGVNYIFMSSYDGIMLVQPFEPQNEGTNQWDFQDVKGNYTIRELVKAAKEKPEGSFVAYYNIPPNKKTSEEKLSFVMGIPEIGAYIGTGMYVESSYLELQKTLQKQRYGFLFLTGVLLLAVMVYLRTLMKNNLQLTKEIQERKNAENNIRTMFDTIHDAIIIHDEYGKILEVNQRADHLYQLPEGKILECSIADLSVDRLLAAEKLKEIENMGQDQSLVFEWECRRPGDGKVFYVEVALRKSLWSGKKVVVAAVRDISDRKAAEELLKDSEKRYKTLYETANDAVAIIDDQCRFIECNNKTEELFGCSKSELKGKAPFEFSPEKQPDGQLSPDKAFQMAQLVLSGQPQKFEWQHFRMDGMPFYAEVNLNRLELKDGTYIQSTMRDITERHQFLEKLQNQFRELQATQYELQAKHDELSAIHEELTATEEELRRQYDELQASQSEYKELADRYSLVLEASNDVIWDWSAKSEITYFSNRLKELLGYAKDELGVNIEDIYEFIHPEDRERFDLDFQKHIEDGTDLYWTEFRMKVKDGSYKWFLSRGKAILDREGKVIRNAGSLTDINDRKLNEEKIRQLAYFDYLTGLPNRVSIVNELKDRLSKCSLDGCHGSIFFIDVDNFKMINDTFGHFYGDRVLVELANKMKTLARDHITFGRIGGDEFIVIQDVYKNDDQIRELAENILTLFTTPVLVDGNSFNVTCSIGIARYPNDGSTVEEILKNADLAMYKGKTQGKNKYVLFEDKMGVDLTERIELEKHLKNAFSSREFVLYYQPQVDSATRKIIGFEALIRWNSPVYGFVPPNRFIPIAEEMGLINEIGKWVIEESFAFASNVRDKDICISCNISSLQLIQSSFVQDVLGPFEKYGLKEGSVALEITESSLIESFGEVTEKLAKLRERGIRIHLDDFGTGYSSLTYLKNLPIDVVKIDKSFINDIIHDGLERRIVKTIISLAQEIGLEVVAEGVETEDQLAYLTECNCNYIQGYLISKPVPEKEAEKL
ncbi:MAG: EAL domain-containing protein [Clostridia bacterium]|nr:EAL domain-containing protein [Clostridia bacterium]